MINSRSLEVPISQINSHGPKDVRAIEILLYVETFYGRHTALNNGRGWELNNSCGRALNNSCERALNNSCGYNDVSIQKYESGQSISHNIACPPSEHLDKPAHSHSLIGVFAIRVKTFGILGYPKSALRRLWADCAEAQAITVLARRTCNLVGNAVVRLMFATDVYTFKLYPVTRLIQQTTNWRFCVCVCVCDFVVVFFFFFFCFVCFFFLGKMTLTLYVNCILRRQLIYKCRSLRFVCWIFIVSIQRIYQTYMNKTAVSL